MELFVIALCLFAVFVFAIPAKKKKAPPRNAEISLARAERAYAEVVATPAPKQKRLEFLSRTGWKPAHSVVRGYFPNGSALVFDENGTPSRRRHIRMN